MPLRWTEPEVFLEYANVTIYHTYNDDDWERRLECWYTVDVAEDDGEFDIRDLPEFNEKLSHGDVLIQAIDNRSPILMEALRQVNGENDPDICPRCGKLMPLNPHRRALSRQVDVDVCPLCGGEEAMLDYERKPHLPPSEWYQFPAKNKNSREAVQSNPQE